MKADGKDEPVITNNRFTALCLAWNVILSILIVILNKWVYVYVNFPNITMTMYHFAMTFAGLLVCRALNVFQVKKLPLRHMLPLATTFCGFVVFTNLSLGHNTVGTYQIIKTLTMPTIMVIQHYWYKKSFSLGIKLTLVPLTLGVYLSTYYDIRFNILGTCYALAGVVVTSLYQVWVGEKQKEFQVNSMQLLFYQAPLSALMLVVLVPIVEPPWAPGGFLYQHWSWLHLMLVLSTGVVAFLVNLSIYWIIGNTSAVTYNVVGHMKLMLVLVGGFVVFQDPVHTEQAIGIVVTLTGVLLYTYIKVQQSAKERPLKETTKAALPSPAEAKPLIKT
ncbi:solute carrier family 35 member E3 isoform X1 [Rhipicephalus microplus]|uniref:solute carrier family 35 member E3 isoform X1 n=1 Tax=Rhipicephalus microplus TaxID=6941 RepID=UPI003F6C9D73